MLKFDLLTVAIGTGLLATPILGYALRYTRESGAVRYWVAAWLALVANGIGIAVPDLVGLREVAGSSFSVFMLCGSLSFVGFAAHRWLLLAPALATVHVLVAVLAGTSMARYFGLSHGLLVVAAGLILAASLRRPGGPAAAWGVTLGTIAIGFVQLLQPLDLSLSEATEARSYVTAGLAVSTAFFQLFTLIESWRSRERWLERQRSTLQLVRAAAAEKVEPRKALANAVAQVETMRPFVAFGVWTKADEEFTLLEERGLDSVIPHHLRHAPSSRPILQAASERSEPLFIDDLTTDSRVMEASQAMGVRRAVIAPIRNRGVVLGVLGAALAPRFPLDDTTRSFIAELANTFGLTLANIRLRESLLRSRDMEALGTLAGGLAHDFNNHLMTILNESNLLRAELSEDHPHHSRLLGLEEAAGECAILARDLVDLARPKTRVTRVVDLGPAFEQAERLIGSAIPTRARFVVGDVTGIPPLVADEHDLQRVLTNLLLNARDSIGEEGTIELSACLSIDPDSGAESIEIVVRDDGPGIAEEARARMFDPFFSTKEPGEGGGLGLGLAICRELVESYGGSIEVESKRDCGSTFRVRWPRGSGATASEE